MSWFVYMVRCADSSFYTGIARDVEKRIEEHNHNKKLAAKYTRGRLPVKLMYAEATESRSSASKREYDIKQLSRQDKAALALGFNAKLTLK